jgi:hypothetical protein
MSERYEFNDTVQGILSVSCDGDTWYLDDAEWEGCAIRQLLADIAERDARIADLRGVYLHAQECVVDWMARAERAEAELARLRAQEPVFTSPFDGREVRIPK